MSPPKSDLKKRPTTSAGPAAVVVTTSPADAALIAFQKDQITRLQAKNNDFASEIARMEANREEKEGNQRDIIAGKS